MAQENNFDFDKWLAQGQQVPETNVQPSNTGFDLDQWIANSMKSESGIKPETNIKPERGKLDYAQDTAAAAINVAGSLAAGAENTYNAQFNQEMDMYRQGGLAVDPMGKPLMGAVFAEGLEKQGIDSRQVIANSQLLKQGADAVRDFTETDVRKANRQAMAEAKEDYKKAHNYDERGWFGKRAVEAGAALNNISGFTFDQILDISESLAPTIATAVATKGATLPTLGVGGLMSAGDFFDTTIEHFKGMPQDKIEQIDAYQSLRQQGLNDADARYKLATDLNEHAPELFSVIASGAVLDRLGGLSKFGTKAAKVSDTRLGRLGSEVLTEAIDEPFQGTMARKAIKDIDAEQDIWEGLGEELVMGAAGGLGGGAISAVGHRGYDGSIAPQSEDILDRDITQATTSPQPTDTAETTTQSVDEKALETVLADYKAQAEEADYKEMYDDLKADIAEGKIHERAAEDYGDTQYRDFARAYLAQAEQTQSTPQPEQAVETEQDFANSEQQIEPTQSVEMPPIANYGDVAATSKAKAFTEEQQTAIAHYQQAEEEFRAYDQKFDQKNNALPEVVRLQTRQQDPVYQYLAKKKQDALGKAEQLGVKNAGDNLFVPVQSQQAASVKGQKAVQTEKVKSENQTYANQSQWQSETQPITTVNTDVRSYGQPQELSNAQWQVMQEAKAHQAELEAERTKARTVFKHDKKAFENPEFKQAALNWVESTHKMRALGITLPQFHRYAEQLAKAEANKAQMESNVRFSRSPIKSVEANIKRGSEAMFQSLQHQKDIENAMYRDDIGWIDFIWGSEGEIKPNSTKRKGAKGISHIKEKRVTVDHMSNDEVTDFLTNAIPETIAKGSISRDYEVSGTKSIAIEYNGNEVHLIKKGDNNAWLLTGFVQNQPMNQSRGATTSDLRTNSPIRSRTEMGAVGTDNVQQTAPQRNTQIEQDQQTLSRILGEETARHVHIINSNTTIPTGRNVKKLAAKGIEGWFDISHQKLYLISDNITATETLSRDERLAWVAWHELAHAGVRMKYGRALKNLLSSAGKNPVVSVLARRIQAERAKLGETLSREVAIEEAMAELYATTETGNWAALESRYHMRIAPSWKKGKDNVRDFLAKIANLFRRLIGGVIRRDVSQTMTTGQVFDTLSGIKQGIADIAQNQAEPTARSNESNGETRHSLNENPKSEFVKGEDTLSESAYNQAKANGETELTFRQWKQVRSPEFKRWFGDWENDPANASKVINPKTGEPLVVYHGTGGDFSIFNASKEGIHFGTQEAANNRIKDSVEAQVMNPDTANIMPVFLNLKNVIRTEDKWNDWEIYISLFKKQGYDGAVYTNLFESPGIDSYIAFNENQIKSAIGNNGSFSRDNDDIRFSRRPKSESLEKLRQAETIRISGKDIEPSNDLKQYRKNAFEYGKGLRGSYTNKDTGHKIELGRAAVTEVLHHDLSKPEHLQSIAAIPQIIENAVYVDTLPNEDVAKNPHIKEYDYYVAGLNIGGTDYTVKAAVSLGKNGDRYYDHKLTAIEKGKLLSLLDRLSNAGASEINSPFEKGELLSLPSRITTPVGESSSPLSMIDDKRLLQILQDENSTEESEGDIRYSRKQSTLDTIKAGKIEHNDDPTIFGNIKSGNFSEAWKTLTRNADFLLTDETRPVVEWVNGLDLSRAEQVDILSELDRADGIRHALNATVSQRFLKPLQQNIAALAKKHKKEVDWTKHVVESYISAKWSITRNQQILAREQKAMDEAKTAMEAAQREALLAEEGSDKRYAEATRAYRRAERRYLDRKHDIELKNWETDEHGDFVVKRKVGVAGWSIPHAQAIMAEAEKHFSAQEMEQAAKPIRQAVSWNIAKNMEANRITAEQAAEYRKHPDYVPLTGDPDRADNDDFIGGASQRGVNTARDKAQKGRTNSEAEGAIDAVYKMLDKTIANYAWQPFKNKVNEVYEQALSEEKAAGKSDMQAKKAVAERTGIERAILKGIPSDDVLIRKYGNVYYEYRLPETVIKALKGSQRNETDYKLGKFFEWSGIKTLTGWYAQGVTQFKPMFAPKNMIRDVWEKSALLTTREIIGADGKDLSQKAKNRIGRKTFSALYNLKETARLMKATKALAKGDTENLNTKDEYQRDLKELIELGGVSNYSTYLARTEKDLVSEIEKLNNPRGRFVEGAKHLVALWNGTFDYVSSLAAYRALKAEGVSAERAAAIVLNLSNFRKQGWAAKHFKPLYMFLNPTLQGGKNIVQMMSTKQGWLYLAGRTTMAMAVWSLLMSLDDEDEETGKRMFANGDLSREILIPTGEKDRYIRVPVGYGAPQVVNNLAVNLVALMNNQITAADAFANIVAHNAKSVMPVSPSEISASKYPLEKLADTLTPTMFKSLTQWVMDRNAFGNRIKPSFVQGDKLLSQQSKSTTAEFWQETAKWMQDNLGFDAHPEAYKHIFDSYRGMMGVLGDFASAVIENPNREMHGKSTIMPIVQDFFGIKGENRASNLYYEYKGEAQELMKEFNYHKENGTLAQWRTPEKMRAVLWNQKADSEINRFRKLKAKLNKDKGKISDETYATRLQRYNQNIERIHRKMVYEWRKQQGLHTVRTQ